MAKRRNELRYAPEQYQPSYLRRRSLPELTQEYNRLRGIVTRRNREFQKAGITEAPFPRAMAQGFPTAAQLNQNPATKEQMLVYGISEMARLATMYRGTLAEERRTFAPDVQKWNAAGFGFVKEQNLLKWRAFVHELGSTTIKTYYGSARMVEVYHDLDDRAANDPKLLKKYQKLFEDYQRTGKLNKHRLTHLARPREESEEE